MLYLCPSLSVAHTVGWYMLLSIQVPVGKQMSKMGEEEISQQAYHNTCGKDNNIFWKRRIAFYSHMTKISPDRPLTNRTLTK